MKKTVILAVLLVLLGMLFSGPVWAKFTCPVFNNFTMSYQDEVEVNRGVEKWMHMKNYAEVMNRVAIHKPQIDYICLRYGIDPYVIYGLVIVESKGDPDAVDGVFKAMLADQNHVGLFQLNTGKVKIPNKAEADRAAKEWRTLNRKVERMARRIKRGKAEPTNEYYELCAKADALKTKWQILDPRFGVFTNLEEAIRYFAHNYHLCDDYSLAIMAHHGGTFSPIRETAYYLKWKTGKYSEKGAIQYLGENHRDYFMLRSWELEQLQLNRDRKRKVKTKLYWSKKADGHLLYAEIVLAATEAFWRYWYYDKKPSSDQGYLGEISPKLAVKVEHTAWYLSPKYGSSDDLEKAVRKGYLTSAPKWLTKAGFKVDPGVGHEDKKDQLLYQMAPVAVWGVLYEIGERFDRKLPKHRKIRITSLVRCKDYIDYGSKTTSHNSGGAIDLNLSSLSLDEKTALHRVLYEMAQDGKLVYYVETNEHKQRNGKGLAFSTFREGGQVHIVANPYKKAHFEQVCRSAGPLPKSTCLASIGGNVHLNKYLAMLLNVGQQCWNSLLAIVASFFDRMWIHAKIAFSASIPFFIDLLILAIVAIVMVKFFSWLFVWVFYEACGLRPLSKRKLSRPAQSWFGRVCLSKNAQSVWCV